MFAGSGNDISAAVIRCVEPAHFGGGDDDAPGRVVGDRAKELREILAVPVGCRHPEVGPGRFRPLAVICENAGPVCSGWYHRQKFRISLLRLGISGPRGRENQKLLFSIASLVLHEFGNDGFVPAQEFGVLVIVAGVALRVGQAVKADPAIVQAATQLVADRPAIAPCRRPSGIQIFGIHTRRLAFAERTALTSAHRQNIGLGVITTNGPHQIATRGTVNRKKPASWSGRRESNPHDQLGRLELYH